MPNALGVVTMAHQHAQHPFYLNGPQSFTNVISKRSIMTEAFIVQRGTAVVRRLCLAPTRSVTIRPFPHHFLYRPKLINSLLGPYCIIMTTHLESQGTVASGHVGNHL